MPTRRVEPSEKEGWLLNQCRSPEHKAPNMLYIPPGEVWEHICPACGAKTIMRGSTVTF